MTTKRTHSKLSEFMPDMADLPEWFENALNSTTEDAELNEARAPFMKRMVLHSYKTALSIKAREQALNKAASEARRQVQYLEKSIAGLTEAKAQLDAVLNGE